MKYLKSFCTFSFIAFALLSCEKSANTSLFEEQPECEVQALSALSYPDFGFPNMEVSVQNKKSGAAAYQIDGILRAYRADTLVEETSLEFGVLQAGELKTRSAWFNNLKEGQMLDSLKIHLFWQNESGQKYESEYLKTF